MAADFAAMTARAMALRAADVTLRLWTPAGCRDRLPQAGRADDRGPDGTGGPRRRVDRRHPDRLVGRRGARLPPARRRTGARGRRRDAGRAGQPARRWQGRDPLAGAGGVDGRPGRLHPDRPPGGALHRAGRAGVGDRRGPGGAAAGDDPTATAGLGRAAQLAAESGHEGTLRLLAGVVDIVEAGSGTVRLRRHVEAADAMALDTRSTRTVRTRPER